MAIKSRVYDRRGVRVVDKRLRDDLGQLALEWIDAARAAHKMLVARGHVPLRQGLVFECYRCSRGARIEQTLDYVGDGWLVVGAMTTEPCSVEVQS